MKKAAAIILAALVAAAGTACSQVKPADTTTAAVKTESTTAETVKETEVVKEGTHIYVLTVPEDHGWTGSVATFAKQKIQEVNENGTYTAELITSANAAEQIRNIEDIVSKGEKNIAMVIQPIDDTVQSAIQGVIDAGIPYVAFDRIIDGVSGKAVSNVKGDNSGIGAGAAAYFVSLGLTPGEPIYVYEGDTSSVTTLRNEGFTKYLTGELEFGGEVINADKKWSQDDLKSITYSGAMNWSRSDTKTSFESLMGDSNNAKIKWFYAEDDELAMGILEALSGGGIDEATKDTFLSGKPVITGCGGLDELYEVLRGKTYVDIASKCGGIMSVTYSPSMIQTAIEDMVDYLDGKQVTQDHVIACENVTSENVTEYPSF
ncbi:substrate-binding domain-containing protein [Lacrimispora celerecrescens]|uniref:Ribose transport system substrate-binding protein n=1 Tax=[Clostridium] celerecrescens 18A TaxID=1286362 RepID=A0A2M8ZBS2_9FIRM|nr:substrate-binding domain-containing protein [Lacrimispora celerecrescens]PJJ30886.1 ribose transport system substrate-binding protein [[Clostridium] celerecrescens 18A]